MGGQVEKEQNFADLQTVVVDGDSEHWSSGSQTPSSHSMSSMGSVRYGESFDSARYVIEGWLEEMDTTVPLEYAPSELALSDKPNFTCEVTYRQQWHDNLSSTTYGISSVSR